MSTMPATAGHSQACCNVPPVVSEGYEPKGKYEEIDGRKTYVTGPESAEKALLVVNDIFGYFPQTLQGADILSTSGDEKYKVFIPDYFDGNPANIEWYPPDTPEKQKKLGEWFGSHSPPATAAVVPSIVTSIQAAYPSIHEWGAVGFCWGGKVVALVASGDDNPFKVAAECHPAMVDPKDAEGIHVPFALLASKDESAEAVKTFEAGLKVDKHVEIFPDQIHGWMGARSKLKDPHIRDEYKRGYETVLKFVQKHL